MCVPRQAREQMSDKGTATEDRDTARPEEARTEFPLTLKRNSKLNKPASGERHQQTVRSQERK